MLRVARDLLARRSELVALTVADVQASDADDGSGIALIRRSKTDQEGEGAVGYLSPRTMGALRAWLAAAGITRGPLFRAVSRHGQVGTRALHPDDVARRFKRLAALAGLDPVPVPESSIPRVTYSHPEVASVGLDEETARATYGDDGVETLTYDLGGNGKSQILQTQGFVKLVRRTDGPVVGVHMVGDRVGELVGEAQLVVAWEAHAEDVAPLVHAHPTQDEALGEAFLALAGKPLHAHG